MAVINFTLHYDDLTNDIDDVDGDVGTAPGIGPVQFIPAFFPGARVPAVDYSPRATGFGLRTFTGYLDADGRLKSERGGTAGVRLWANDPVFGLERLQYRVEAQLTDGFGRPIKFAGFSFDAPTEDRDMYLALEMPRPGQPFARGRSGYDITQLTINGDSELVFTREDGYDLPPVATPLSLDLAASITAAYQYAAAYAMTFGA